AFTIRAYLASIARLSSSDEQSRRSPANFMFLRSVSIILATTVLLPVGWSCAPAADRGSVCPLSTPFPQAMSTPSVPTLTYALIDRSGSYRPLTETALQLLNAVLPEIVRPGDYVMESWIGSDSDEPVTTFFSGRLEVASSGPTPVFPPDPA